MEKNKIKVSLSTILLFFALVAIIIMGFFIYKLNNDKLSESQKISELQSQISSLNDTIKNSQKKDDVIPNATNSSNNLETPVYKINDLTYNIVVNDWSSANDDVEGGFASIYKATLVNSDKKEMYIISYSDVWDIHEANGSKDSVSIEISKISDKKLSNIINKGVSKNITTVKDFLDAHIKTDYDLKITYQSINDIKYDIVVDRKISTLKEDMTSKTADGIYANEYYYELINSQLKKKYKVYVDDLAEVFNNEGEDDDIIIEIETITDDELSQIIAKTNKKIEMLNLYDLLKEHINEEFVIHINEY